MKYPKTFALALLLTLSSLNIAAAQSEEDPLAGFDELVEALEEIENSEEDMDAGGTATEVEDSVASLEDNVEVDATEALETVESTAESTTETAEATAEEVQGKTIGNRLLPKEAPEGKEDHVLYTVPGAINYKGMTFLKIDSSKFFNRYQKCTTPETDKVTNTLAKLKISQGAPLECRESMEYQFMPYRTFRSAR